MNVAVPKEIVAGEHRVALVPGVVRKIVSSGISVLVESGAGVGASFRDESYRDAGANVVSDTEALWGDADVLVKVQTPATDPATGRNEIELLKEASVLVCLLQATSNPDVVTKLASRNITSFGLEALPRITRAQPMDVLSSMSTVAGYKAVLVAAAAQGRFFPMLVTAAGTIPPAKVLVLGAGVAGLQAIATARRLGAVVQAFDVRPAVKEQVESLGAQFIAPEAVSEEAEDAGGYAKELSEEQHKRELMLIHDSIKSVDVAISTALIPGKPAPLLITEDMVRDMRPGSVIVDLAAEAGGNCALTEPGSEVVRHGVTILGPLNLPSSMPIHSSQMFAKNVTAFLLHLVKDGELNLDFEDQIIHDACITHGGRVVHEATRRIIEGGGGV